MILQTYLDGFPTPEMTKEDAQVILNGGQETDAILPSSSPAKPSRLSSDHWISVTLFEEVLFSDGRQSSIEARVEVLQEISGLPEIKGIGEKMTQVLINLLHNTIEPCLKEGNWR